jgi:hypothetical protein
LHTSPVVQASPSSQDAVFAMCMHPPTLSHVSSVQGFWSSQDSEAPGWHFPALHVSPDVHAFPSSHGPSWFACAQPILGSHVSSVHGLSSSQVTDAPPVHTDDWHVSPIVQRSPSSQGSALQSSSRQSMRPSQSSSFLSPQLVSLVPVGTHAGCPSDVTQPSSGLHVCPTGQSASLEGNKHVP